MSAKFGSFSAPAEQWDAVTPSDTVDIAAPFAVRGIYVGGAGNVVAIDKYDNAETFVGVAAGTVLPLAAKRVNATNTTATSIVALG